MTQRYRLRRGTLYTGAHRYDFIGEIIETHTNENNGRQMFRLRSRASRARQCFCGVGSTMTI